MTENEAADTVARNPLLAGLLGGLVALRTAPGLSWWERVLNVLSAGLLAYFLGPAASDYFQLSTPNMQSAAAFMIGLFGMNLVAVTVEYIKVSKLSDFLPINKGGK